MTYTSTTKVSLYILLCVIVCAIPGCDYNTAQSIDSEPTKPLSEISVKNNLLKIHDTSDTNKKQLRKNRVIPLYITGYPQGLSSDNNHIFVGDNNQSEILKIDTSDKSNFSSTRFLLKKSLSYPSHIQTIDDRILISDSDGIKIYDHKGNLKQFVKAFRSFFHFYGDSEGFIYINPMKSDASPDNHLVFKLNKEGLIVSKFGNYKTHSSAFITGTDKHLILGHFHTPKIQIYDKAGEMLVREFNVKHPIFEDLDSNVAEENTKSKEQNTSLKPRYIADISVLQNKIYVLLHLPYIEIVEFDLDGSETGRYVLEKEVFVKDYFGFDTESFEENPRFIIGAVMSSNYSELLFLNPT